MENNGGYHRERLTFSRFVDWGFLAIITLIVGQGASQISKVSSSIEELNQKMAVVIEKIGNQDRRVTSFEERISGLEKVVWGHKSWKNGE